MLTAASLLIALLATPTAGASSAGCNARSEAKTGQVLNETIRDRRYLLFVPPSYSPTTPAPVILSYHGGSRTADDQLALDGLTTPFFNTKYIVVYPYGIDKVWQGVPGVSTDDVGFTESILDKVEKQYCVDTQRIYATGKSDGGGMTGVLACDKALSQRIAAFAPVSAAFYIDSATCHPDKVKIPCDAGRGDVPVLEFHGGNDTTIKYEGGKRKKACLPSIPHWVQAWAERDGLGSQNVSSKLTSEATKYVFGTGANEGLVTHIFDGVEIGHDWPSTVANADNSRSGHHRASFNASSIILDFFAAHPLRKPSSQRKKGRGI